MAIVPQKRYFVYSLDRPAINGTPGTPFYVGKGTGKRPDNHLAEARSPDCYCRKCRIIRLIWAMGKDVTITYHFESNDQHEAQRIERDMIRRLSVDGSLCNRANSRVPYGPEIPIAQMTYEEYRHYLRSRNLSRREYQKAHDEWISWKLNILRRALTQSRRQRQSDKADELQKEIDELRFDSGLAHQEYLL